MNEVSIGILKEKLRECKKHPTEIGSLIPDIQQSIDILSNSKVIVDGIVGNDGMVHQGRGKKPLSPFDDIAYTINGEFNGTKVGKRFKLISVIDK